LQDLHDWGWSCGSVNSINADLQSLREHSSAEDISDDDLAFDPVEGCAEQDVGWMKIAGPRVGSDRCGFEMDTVLWYLYYVRPDNIFY
jgi:hypothetical protein